MLSADEVSTAPHYEETLEVVVKGDWGFISVIHQRHHIPLYGFKERDFVLLHTFKKHDDGTCMCAPPIPRHTLRKCNTWLHVLRSVRRPSRCSSVWTARSCRYRRICSQVLSAYTSSHINKL